MKPQRSYSWETIIIAVSFVAVWIYFIAWIIAGRNETPLSPAWQLLLLPAFILLAVIFIRRVQRVMGALRESKSTPPFPPTANRPKK